MPFGFGNSRRRRSSSRGLYTTAATSPASAASTASTSNNRSTRVAAAKVAASPAATLAAAYATSGQGRSGSMTSLSNQAAAAALKKQYRQQYEQPGVAAAAAASTSPVHAKNISRSNSLSSMNLRHDSRGGRHNNNNNNIRSNSLTMNTSAAAAAHLQAQLQAPSKVGRQISSNSRSNSLTSSLRSSHANTVVTTRYGPDKNTVIRTTRETGADGRTKSLTKQTITRMGSFEVVKTTTIKPPLKMASSSASSGVPSRTNSLNYQGSLLSAGDSELGNIAEEFDEDFYRDEDDVINSPRQTHFIKEPLEEKDEEKEEQEQNNVNSDYARQHTYRQLTQGGVQKHQPAQAPIQAPAHRINTATSPTRSILKKHHEQPLQDTVGATQKNLELGAKDDISDSGNSVYSDAYDALPRSKNDSSKNNKNFKVVVKSNPNNTFATPQVVSTTLQQSQSKSTNSSELSTLAKSDQDKNSAASSTKKSVIISLPVNVNNNGINNQSPPLRQDEFMVPLNQKNLQSNPRQDEFLVSHQQHPNRQQQNHKQTPDELYAMAFKVAEERYRAAKEAELAQQQAQAQHLQQQIYDDIGYTSDSSFQRVYNKEHNTGGEYPLSLRSSETQLQPKRRNSSNRTSSLLSSKTSRPYNNINDRSLSFTRRSNVGGRTASLDSRNASLLSDQHHQFDGGNGNENGYAYESNALGYGFKAHTLRGVSSQNEPSAMQKLKVGLLSRSASTSHNNHQVTDKMKRKEEMKRLKQERLAASELAGNKVRVINQTKFQNAGEQQQQQQQQQEQQEQRVQKHVEPPLDQPVDDANPQEQAAQQLQQQAEGEPEAQPAPQKRDKKGKHHKKQRFSIFNKKKGNKKNHESLVSEAQTNEKSKTVVLPDNSHEGPGTDNVNAVIRESVKESLIGTGFISGDDQKQQQQRDKPTLIPKGNTPKGNTPKGNTDNGVQKASVPQEEDTPIVSSEMVLQAQPVAEVAEVAEVPKVQAVPAVSATEPVTVSTETAENQAVNEAPSSYGNNFSRANGNSSNLETKPQANGVANIDSNLANANNETVNHLADDTETENTYIHEPTNLENNIQHDGNAKYDNTDNDVSNKNTKASNKKGSKNVKRNKNKNPFHKKVLGWFDIE